MAARHSLLGTVVWLVCGATPGLAQSQPARPWHYVAGLSDTAATAPDDGGRRRIAAEIALANWNQARALLLASSGDSALVVADHFDLWAAASIGAGLIEEAASWLAAEGEFSSGRNRAVAFARAGLAYECLGWDSSAAEYYDLAADSYPPASGWLALRIARVSDGSSARLMLRKVPESGSRLRQTVGAQLQLRQGNWSGAAEIYRRLGQLDSAIAIALRAGDSTLAVGWALEALETSSNDNRRAALDLLTAPGRRHSVEESIGLAAAALELGNNATAIEMATAALAAGDSSAAPFRIRGRAQERSGDRVGALDSYRLSAERGGDQAVESRYSHGRLLLALRRYGEAVAELRRFATEFPEHPYAAAALGSVAARLIAQGDLGAADNVVGQLHLSHPGSAEASAARIALAQAAAGAGSPETAWRWYRAETASGGRDRHFARHAMSDLWRQAGDTAAADSLLGELADADPLGYYGFRARVATGRPPPTFDAVEPVAASERIVGVLDQLDFLADAGFTEEAEVHVAYWVRNDSLTADEMLELAEGLVLRGEVAGSIALGWRASRTVGLRDIRVVRAIFPWPFRELIEAEAREWNVDPYLVAAIIRQESAFDPVATSRAGARGLMQLMPATASWRAGQAGYPWNEHYLGVPDANLHIGIGHLVDLLGRYDDIVFALAAYNAGGGNLARWRRRDDMNDPDTFVERIPFPETQGYVKAVLRNRYLYRALYGG